MSMYESLVRVESRTLNGGMQVVYTFDNGYQASVIDHSSSYGLEMAVMYDGEIVYDTPITSDVVSYLSEEDLGAVLRAVSELPPRS